MRIRCLFLALIAGVAAAWATEPADTVVSVADPHSVVVMQRGDSTVVDISGAGTNKRFKFHYAVAPDTVTDDGLSVDMPFFSRPPVGKGRKMREVTAFKGIYGGMVFPVRDQGRLALSWEVGVNSLIGYSVRRGGAGVSVGVGFGYRRMAMDGNLILEKSGDQLIAGAAPEGTSDVSAHIGSWAIHLPVMYTQRLHRSFGFSIGVVANFNFYTTASMEYRSGDVKYSSSIKGLHQRILTPDILFTVGSVGNAGLYVRWSPVRSFSGRFGPEYSFVSTGVSLAF